MSGVLVTSPGVSSIPPSSSPSERKDTSWFLRNPYDLGALLSAGEKFNGEARKLGCLPFFTKGDENGCFVFYAPSEDWLVTNLLGIASEMKEEKRTG